MTNNNSTDMMNTVTNTNTITVTFAAGYQLTTGIYNALVTNAKDAGKQLTLVAGNIEQNVRLDDPDAKNNVYRINLGTGHLKKTETADKKTGDTKTNISFYVNGCNVHVKINVSPGVSGEIIIVTRNKKIVCVSGDFILGAGLIAGLLRDGLQVLRKYTETNIAGNAISTGYYYSDITVGSPDILTAMLDIKKILIGRLVDSGEINPKTVVEINNIKATDVKKHLSGLTNLL